MIVLDTGGLFALLVETEVHHERVREALERESPPFVLSPFVLCELDYLLTTHTNVDTELGFLSDVAAGAYEVSFETEDIAAAREMIERYTDLNIGLADASTVVLANRLETDRVLTLDQRHFRVLRTKTGRPLTLVP